MIAAMESSTAAIMPRLRESTAQLHDSVEKHPFQAALMAGTLPREAFAEFLTQMWFVHRCLEAELRRHQPSDPAIEAVVFNYQFKEEQLVADLAFFGVKLENTQPTQATRALLATIRSLSEQSPLALLGLHYVLEGSTNGGKFVAKRVSAAFGLTGPDGLRYLDAYGDAQRANWQAFKQNMDAQRFSADQQDALVEAAKTMFSAIGGICEDLWRARAA